MPKSYLLRSPRQTELIRESRIAARGHQASHGLPRGAEPKIRLRRGKKGRREREKSTDRAMSGEKAPTAGGEKHRQGNGKKHLLIISPGRWMTGLAVR